MAKYYIGHPIKVDIDDGDRPARPHTKAERTRFSQPAARKLLARFATYVRGDRRTAFGHVSSDEPFMYEDGHPGLLNLLEAAHDSGMQSLLCDIGDKCSDQSTLDRRLLAKIIGTMATDSPTVSYLPCAVAESVLAFLASAQSEPGFDSDLQDAFQLEDSLLFEFFVALDRLHDDSHIGQAVTTRYVEFLKYLAERSLKCGVGGPDVPA